VLNDQVNGAAVAQLVGDGAEGVPQPVEQSAEELDANVAHEFAELSRDRVGRHRHAVRAALAGGLVNAHSRPAVLGEEDQSLVFRVGRRQTHPRDRSESLDSLGPEHGAACDQCPRA